MTVSGPNVVDFLLVLAPLLLAGYFGVRGILPVFRGKFAIAAVAMFLGAAAISMVLSFISFTLITVMDESITAAAVSSSSSSGSGSNVAAFSSPGALLVPVAKFFARSRFVRSVLVAFLQPSLLSVSGIACCLMLVYVREALVRMGSDTLVLMEHFAIFNSAEKQ